MPDAPKSRDNDSHSPQTVDKANKVNFLTVELCMNYNAEDDIDPPTSAFARTASAGGDSRKIGFARVGPIHREGPAVLQTFIFPLVAGRNRAKYTSYRRRYTADDLENMLEENHIPAGLSEKLVKERLEILRQREQRIKANTADIARRHKFG
jgi:hypothetical protein